VSSDRRWVAGRPARPDEDQVVVDTWSSLGLPGVVDLHVHFMPDRLLRSVWAYFDQGGPLVSRPVPVAYRYDEDERTARLRSMGAVAWTTLLYPHKPGMAVSLNAWAREFAERCPEAVQTGTFFPEEGAAEYVAAAVDAGARIFKAHVAVGRYDPLDPLLDGVWGSLADSGTPVVIHASGSPASPYTGPDRIRTLLERHPSLRLVFAHLGMPEYDGFLQLVREYERCGADTSMVFDDHQAGAAPDLDWAAAQLAELRTQIYWGTDFPNTAHAVGHQMERLLELGLGDDWMRAALYDNAAALLGLPEAAVPSAQR
jgi:hypothetical protein